MKFSANKAKPPVGMECFLALSMAPNQTPEQSAEAILAFTAGVGRLTNEMNATWVRMRMTGIPEELEWRLQTALDEFNAAQAAAKPKLQLVVDNG